ncbi:BON domain-containing protein [Pseudodesulfovibrio sp.]|uniref:BON domain-containing protein n=1 Tax=Pseudodesulfovibrio sp. TaxID=2035812 RepID=UPI0026184CD8|nr:BON domain-containing protein [Pseudodesulfovibrio sp.]MDD3313271.1 BON domain-containing protein [Pseudodesulfovibrio sp.]
MQKATILAASVLLAALFLLNGCTAYNVAVDERTTGQWVDDNTIALTIEKDFLADDLVKYLDYDAFSYRGHVYVVGEYESREQVDRAVKLAKGVEGVRQVTTYLLPKREDDGCSTADKLGIYQKLKQALVDDKNIWSTNIEIEIVQCNVVLLGIVGSSAEKSAAEAHAKAVKGVRSVKSFLTVK